MPRTDGGGQFAGLQHHETRDNPMITPELQMLQRKNASEVLRALAVITQTRAAEMAQISETKLSRMLSPQSSNEASELDKFCALLAACNLVLVPRTWNAVDPDELRATRLLARKALDADTRESAWGSLT
jgi:hypothetical protein